MNNDKTRTDGFECINCHKMVRDKAPGTVNRNHCPFCLTSKHVDLNIAGDRKATCKQVMQPIGLTFKEAGLDKWGKQKQGELMVAHQCLGCTKISINRVAGDDDPKKILEILESSKDLDEDLKKLLMHSGIKLLTDADLPEIKTQLFGKE
ncbi:MAG: RNHCP domain-containing protein [Candidatus Daviesbacteria bacterium]|nr:RNHCP domain-containing protein [Candidatus Daviesbacteria bacterium]